MLPGVCEQYGALDDITTEDVLATITATPGFPSDEASREALVTTKRFLEMPVSTLAPQIEVVLNRAHDAIMTDNMSIDDGIAEMNKGVSELE